MSTSKFRATLKGRLSALIFITPGAGGKTASIIPITVAGLFGDDTMEAKASRLFHQHFDAAAPEADIFKSLLKQAGYEPDQILVRRVP